MSTVNRGSLYWDDFELRVHETVHAIKTGTDPVIRRVAIFITERCNFSCKYCNHKVSGKVLSMEKFMNVLDNYGDSAIIHITGGEPSTIPWLYPLIEATGNRYRFHLNTNAYITPPSEFVKRLKISLDHYDAAYWDCLVGCSGAFGKVVNNIKNSINNTVVSLTYTLTKENYKDSINFTKFSNKEFPGLYALFFSVYKGTDPRYFMDDKTAEDFFNNVLPKLQNELPPESLSLIKETIDEKRRIMQGVRFPQNIYITENSNKCYISMSERVVSPEGEEFTCSHLYRDKIHSIQPIKNIKCLYGCNRRLVEFNEQVQRELQEVIA